MLMSFGMFQFEIGTLPYQELSRSRAWRFGRSERFGAMPATQFLGPGDDQVTLSGALVPGLAGRFSAIESLAEMADKGEGWPLTDGVGNVLGTFVVDKLDHKASQFMVDGLARKGDFSLTLTRIADE